MHFDLAKCKPFKLMYLYIQEYVPYGWGIGLADNGEFTNGPNHYYKSFIETISIIFKYLEAQFIGTVRWGYYHKRYLTFKY